MFDPYDAKQLQQLDKAVRASHKKLEPHRDARRELVRDFVGTAYGTDFCRREMPVNMLSLMVDVYLMNLAGDSPQVLLPTARKDILPYIADLEAIVNKELRDMQFDKTLRKWVLEAIFSMGILKCGLVDADYIEVIPGQPQPSQEYFADLVDFDDFSYDTESSSWDRVTFMADRYRVDYEALMGSEHFDEQGKIGLRLDEADWETTPERTSDFSTEGESSETAQDSAFRKTTWVWDICLPEEGIVVTIADNADDTVFAPLKVVEWDGVSNTPYHCLWFTDVPGNAMPLPPGQVVKSLNRTINALYRTLVQQAKRQKTIGVYRYGDEQEAKRVQNARDGELVGLQDPTNVQEVSFGGASPENLAFTIQARDLFSLMAGNLDAMGGLGPQSETFRQDAMIAQTVSKKSARMSRAVVDATTEVVRDFVYRLWNDPLNYYTTTRPIAGTRVQVQAELIPGVRYGEFHEFDIRIEPYSMQYKSPQERGSDIIQLLTNVVFPMMPFLQQQGIGVNLQHVFEMLSKYLSLPELQLIFEFIGAPLPGTGRDGEAKQPQVSHRTYERVSRPGATRQGNDQTMQQILMGGNPQQAERAALGRPTGV